MASRREGSTLGQYRLIEQIGQGGMATVYKAYQPSMQRYVAIKILPPQHAEDPRFVERFIREARTIAKLEHKNILPVHDFGEERGTTYLAMRYLEGGTLKDIIGQGRLTLADAADLLSQVCAALDYAHRQGVVHRDVKPANIIIDEEGSAYLTDFGIAKVLEGTSELTETGAAIGTPTYMAPEQSLGKAVDARTDIYALGVILYEMVVGQAPYEADTPMAVALAHIHEPLPLPRQIDRNIPEAVEAVIIKALAKEPDDRHQTANDLSSALKDAIRQAGVISPESTLMNLVTEARTIRRERATVVAAETAASAAAALDDEAFPRPKVERERRRILVLALGIGVAAALVVGAIGLVVFGGLFGREQATPAGASAVATVYDSFDDPVYDGDVNNDLWARQFYESTGACDMVQQEGVLVVSNTASEQSVSCSLIIRPDLLPSLGSELQSIEARIQISSDHDGEFVDTVFYMSPTDLPEWGWHTSCGLQAHADGKVNILFVVRDARLGPQAELLYSKEYGGIRYDRWYTIRLEVDPDTMTFSCLIDGERVGSYTPENVTELREARFEQLIMSWRDPGAIGTFLLDDFRLLR